MQTPVGFFTSGCGHWPTLVHALSLKIIVAAADLVVKDVQQCKSFQSPKAKRDYLSHTHAVN